MCTFDFEWLQFLNIRLVITIELNKINCDELVHFEELNKNKHVTNNGTHQLKKKTEKKNFS